MSLRTYPLIVHPAFVAFVEHARGADHGLYGIKPVEVPTHRPNFDRITQIADFLDVSPLIIRAILRKPEKHYREFSFKKKSGGNRTIRSPRTFLKVVQWWILDTILYNSEVSAVAHGFVPYKSFLSNAQEHLGARHLLNVDIQEFFPSIRTEDVQNLFVSLGYKLEVASHLTRLTTYQNELPQGAPTSPAIANLIMRDFDAEMALLCAEREIKYTRYADDLTFSSQEFITPDLVDEVVKRLGKMGLTLHGKKTRFCGPNDRKEVTGLILGRERVNLPRPFLNKCRGWFHRILREAEQHLHDENRVRGTVALVRQIQGAGSQSVLRLRDQALTALGAARLRQIEANLAAVNHDFPASEPDA